MTTTLLLTSMSLFVSFRRRYNSCRWSWFLLLSTVVVNHHMTTVTALVHVPSYNVSFPSMPALFGRKWPTDADNSNEYEPITAKLHFFSDWPLLCEISSSANNKDGSSPSYGELNWEMDHTFTSDDNDNNKNTNENDYEKNLPIALLAKRGECTFFEKAAVASRLGSAVQYLIVYDNQVRSELVPMSSEFPDSKNMSLLFVTYAAGIELRNMLEGDGDGDGDDDRYTNNNNNKVNYDNYGSSRNNNTSSSSSSSSYLLVEMDGSVPPFMNDPPMPDLTLTGYMLAAMTGFLVFLIFFGCVLLCAQAGFITARSDERGRIILFAGRAAFVSSSSNPREVAMRIMSNGVLTEEQIHQYLKEETFRQGGNNNNNDNGNSENGTGKAVDENNYDDHDTHNERDTTTTTDSELEDGNLNITATSESSCNSNSNNNEEQEEEGNCYCSCAICLDEFENGEKVRVLPCNHKFHDACLIPWLTERHSSCPLCKFDVLEFIIQQRTGRTSTTNDDDDDDDDGESNLDAIALNDNNNNNNLINNHHFLASCWMHLRQFRGWTLLLDHDGINITTVTAANDTTTTTVATSAFQDHGGIELQEQQQQRRPMTTTTSSQQQQQQREEVIPEMEIELSTTTTTRTRNGSSLVSPPLATPPPALPVVANI